MTPSSINKLIFLFVFTFFTFTHRLFSFEKWANNKAYEIARSIINLTIGSQTWKQKCELYNVEYNAKAYIYGYSKRETIDMHVNLNSCNICKEDCRHTLNDVSYVVHNIFMHLESLIYKYLESPNLERLNQVLDKLNSYLDFEYPSDLNECKSEDHIKAVMVNIGLYWVNDQLKTNKDATLELLKTLSDKGHKIAIQVLELVLKQQDVT